MLDGPRTWTLQVSPPITFVLLSEVFDVLKYYFTCEGVGSVNFSPSSLHLSPGHIVITRFDYGLPVRARTMLT